MRCSVPRIFGFDKWFERHFSDLCKKHDKEYKTFCPYKKIKADISMAWHMAKRKFPLLAFLTLIFLSTCGSVYWIYKRTKDLIR